MSETNGPDTLQRILEEFGMRSEATAQSLNSSFRERTAWRKTDLDKAVASINALFSLKAALLDELIAKASAVVADARGRSGGSVYMTHAEEFLALKAVLAKHHGRPQ